MDMRARFRAGGAFLMEGALGERLKREYGLTFDDTIAMAGLVYTEAGRSALNVLWRQYAAIAARHGLPFLATTPTRRADRERVNAAGRDETIIADNMRFLREIKPACGSPMYAGGLMGCRGDAYTGEGALPEGNAREFHAWQAQCFKRAGADFLYAAIMPALPEAVGMARALADTGLPYIISFTIRPDGRLVDGTPIHEAIVAIDEATEGSGTERPLCYMTNCVHPAIAHEALSRPCNRTETVRERFKGIQANTSSLPYAELDGAGELHRSEPEDLGRDMARLITDMGLTVMGGCCGTDDRHMEVVARLLAEGNIPATRK